MSWQGVLKERGIFHKLHACNKLGITNLDVCRHLLMVWIIGWKLTLPEILKTAKAVSDHSLKLNAISLLRA